MTRSDRRGLRELRVRDAVTERRARAAQYLIHSQLLTYHASGAFAANSTCKVAGDDELAVQL